MANLKNISLAIVILLFPVLTSFHHGWANYNQKIVLDFESVIERSAYENPHSLIRARYKEDLWTIYLAPVNRMASRGISAAMIQKGTPVRIVGYPHKTIKNEMRAERIFIKDKKFELR